MTLFRNVDGKDVQLTPEEEAAVRAEWAAWTLPPTPTDQLIDEANQNDPILRGLIGALAARFGVTRAQVVQLIKNSQT